VDTLEALYPVLGFNDTVGSNRFTAIYLNKQNQLPQKSCELQLFDDRCFLAALKHSLSQNCRFRV
jgi:hypothetical protein